MQPSPGFADREGPGQHVLFVCPVVTHCEHAVRTLANPGLDPASALPPIACDHEPDSTAFSTME